MLRIAVELPADFASAGEFLADAQAYEAAGAEAVWLAPSSDGLLHPAGDAERVGAAFDAARQAGAPETFELWGRVGAPGGRAEWRQALDTYAELGATGIVVAHAANLLDILRNPEEDDRQDLAMAVG